MHIRGVTISPSGGEIFVGRARPGRDQTRRSGKAELSMVNGVYAIPLCPGAISERASDARSGPPLGSFVGGDENRLVESIVCQLRSGNCTYQPLVFCGPRSCGKSFLAHGLAEIWRTQYVADKVVVTSGADFARHYAGAVDTEAIPDFHAHFQTATLVVLDDLDSLAGKNAAQQELIHLLDDVNPGCQWIITSRHPPAEMSSILGPLASRLSVGLIVSVKLPGRETRKAVLQLLADHHEVVLSERVRELLVDSAADSPSQLQTVPQLNHAVLQLSQLAEERHQEIDLETTTRFLQDHASSKKPSVRQIATLVARYFQLKVSDLKGPSRQQQLVRARAIAMFLSRSLTDCSLADVGKFFGGRDHTTVLHACRKTERLCHSDQATKLAVAELVEQVSKPE